MQRKFIGLVFALVVVLAASSASAWTGPTSAPPNGNVSAPVNVGTTDQVKNAALGVNALAVFGNAILSGASRYLNWGTTAGSSGYGIRDTGGTLEFKNSGGSWASLQSIISGLVGGGSQWTTSGNNIYSSNSGNVGIGTASPTYKLTVTGGAIGGTFGLLPKYAAWAAYGTGDGGAAIYNDSGSFKKLMVVGNNSAGGSREVGVWDNLTVSAKVTAPQYCIGSSCITSWPSATSEADTLDTVTARGATANRGIQAHRFTDDDSNYYIDANTTSYVNDFRPNIIYDRQNASYQVDPNGTTALNYVEVKNGSEPTINFHRPSLYATGIKLRTDNKLWFGGWSTGEGTAGIVAGAFTDGNNTGYYLDPSGTSNVNNLCLNGTCKTAWPTATAEADTLATVTARGATSNTNMVTTNTSPTLYLADTDHRSAMIHNNSNLLYVLRGCGNGSTSWCQYNGQWPLYINLENNDATFGGAVKGTSFCIGSSCITSWPGNSQWVMNGTSLYYNAGNVGIGTASPAAKLDVAGNLLLSGARSTILYTGDNAGAHRGGIQLVTYNRGVNTILTPTNQSGTTINSTLQLGGFGSFNSNAVNLAVSGNVGIGKTEPTSKLDVAGSINSTGYSIDNAPGINGIITGCYQFNFRGGIITETYDTNCGGWDLAERYVTDGVLPVIRGFIVALSDSTSFQISTVGNPSPGESTSTPYMMTTAKIHVAGVGEREKVLGVVPTKPFGISPGDLTGKKAEAGTQWVTLAGHAPLHMTLEGGPIAIGDPITVSATRPGYGMRATTPGRIVGYALAPYTAVGATPDGTDMIEVFISVENWQPKGMLCASDSSGATCITRAQLDTLIEKAAKIK